LQNIDIGETPKKLKIYDRRLDSLARLLECKHGCVATIIVNKKLYISGNATVNI